MDDNTEKIIPITTLNRILFDDKTYYSFISQEGEFINENPSSYLDDLNKYMKTLLKDATNLKGVIFDRINNINKMFDSNIFYNLYDYKDKTECRVSMSLLENILLDEDTYNKFMNFDNEKEIFKDIPLIEYLVSLIDYMKTIKKLRLSLPEDGKVRFKNIMRKYSLIVKRTNLLSSDDIKEKMDPKLEEKILSSINFDTTPFNISYQLYRELNKRVYYNASFLAYDQSKKDIRSKKIYNRPIDKIREEKPYVVCRSWAVMYAYLLIKCGFKAQVVGNYHKYVIFDCDGTLMKADGTNVKKSDVDGLCLNDISRCQMNMAVDNFDCLEEDKDISVYLSDAYLEFKEDRPSKIDEIKETYKYSYMEKSNLSIDDRLHILSKKGKESNFKNIELTRYLMLIYNNLFANVDEDLEFKYVVIRDGLEFNATILIGRKIDDNYNYYLFDSNNGLNEIKRDKLNIMLKTSMLKVISNDKTIRGISKEVSYGPLK